MQAVRADDDLERRGPGGSGRPGRSRRPGRPQGRRASGPGRSGRPPGRPSPIEAIEDLAGIALLDGRRRRGHGRRRDGDRRRDRAELRGRRHAAAAASAAAPSCSTRSTTTRSATDGDGFVELRNNGAEAADLAGLALVLVDGSDGLEYDREPLTGTLARVRTWRSRSRRRTGRPTASRSSTPATGALLDALSYEGAITAAQIGTGDREPRRGHGAAGVGRRLEHRRRLAQPQPRRPRHGRRGVRLGVHDHRHAGAANVASG